jgi:hypothetical protein
MSRFLCAESIFLRFCVWQTALKFDTREYRTEEIIWPAEQGKPQSTLRTVYSVSRLNTVHNIPRTCNDSNRKKLFEILQDHRRLCYSVPDLVVHFNFFILM